MQNVFSTFFVWVQYSLRFNTLKYFQLHRSNLCGCSTYILIANRFSIGIHSNTTTFTVEYYIYLSAFV